MPGDVDLERRIGVFGNDVLITRQVHQAVVVIQDRRGGRPNNRDFRLAHADLGTEGACDIARARRKAFGNEVNARVQLGIANRYRAALVFALSNEPKWRNGKRGGFKIRCPLGLWVRLPPSVPPSSS